MMCTAVLIISVVPVLATAITMLIIVHFSWCPGKVTYDYSWQDTHIISMKYVLAVMVMLYHVVRRVLMYCPTRVCTHV